jgi:phospholipid/cholesterol/gamma-HCH transport system substrate-binding protein
MNQTFQSIRVGIFFVLGLILIYAVYTVIGDGRAARGDGYVIEAGFDNIRTLSSGADVRMAGVRIGSVASTGLQDGRGLVRLSIDPEVKVPRDSVARIAMASLLGQNYVSVDYGQSDQMLSSGDQIGSEESPDLNAILNQVQDLGERLNSIADSFPDMGESGMGELFENLNQLVTDNRERFDTVMANLESLTGKLNSGEGTLGKLINEDDLYTELMTVVTDFKSASDDMSEALAGANDLIKRVEAGEGTLGRLLVGESIADELETTVANMRAFSDKLNSGEGTLGKLVADDTLYIELRSMLNKADTALDSMGDAGPITAVGAVSGALF